MGHIYVTFRGVEATVKSMQAVGQITEEVANDVLRYVATANVNRQSWDFVREWIIGFDMGPEIVEQIEKDALVENRGVQKV